MLKNDRINANQLCIFFSISCIMICKKGGSMKRKEHPKLSKDFFKQPRPTITMKEALKDSIPFEWSKEVLEEKKKALIVSSKKQLVLANYFY